jgi:deazaflavin-dependent oxidoreductase (nitroreductase family)
MNPRMTKAGNRIAVWLYRRFNGRLSSGPGGRVLMITSPGRTSGLPRSTCVQYLQVPDGYLVWGTGSGSAADPDWVRNLRAAPQSQVQMRSDRFTVIPRELTGTERDEVWEDVILRQQPGVAKYARRAGRTIPVMVLQPLGSPTAP